MRNDPLLQGIAIAFKNMGIRKSSFKTRYNHILEAKRFVKVLRELGFGVKAWKNVTNKHVQRVVDYWVQKQLKVATIKEYLSGVRLVARHFGNDRIAKKNSVFGIGARKTVTNLDRSLPQDVYNKVIAELTKGEKPHDKLIAATFMLQRELGLRREESMKFRPDKAYLPGGAVFITYGTKGGRERAIAKVSPAGSAAIEYAQSVVGSGKNLIPKDKKEHEWRNEFYKRIAQLGVTREKAGSSCHGNRHAYAHERYRQLTLFDCPCKFNNVKDFEENAHTVAGNQWPEKDTGARFILRAELGHGPTRSMSGYLGSIHHK